MATPRQEFTYLPKSYALESHKYSYSSGSAPPGPMTKPPDAKGSNSRSSLLSSDVRHSSFGLPDLAKALSHDKHYPEPVLTQMVALRIEQERTKQIHLKLDLAHALRALIADAERTGHSGDWLKRLFDDDDPLGRVHHASVHGREAGKKALCTPSPMHLPETAAKPKTGSGADSVQSHHSQNHHQQSRTHSSVPTPTTATPKVPTPRAVAHSTHSLTTLASIVSSTPLGHSSSHTSVGTFALSNSAASGMVGAGHNQHFEELGLPYGQGKCPAIVFHSLPNGQPVPAYYYVNSPPGGHGPAMVPSQYFIPPPLAQGMVPWPVAILEKRGEDEPPAKKTKQKGEINFMITTPKNPPARKYNK